jgi:hypothetical protein
MWIFHGTVPADCMDAYMALRYNEASRHLRIAMPPVKVDALRQQLKAFVTEIRQISPAGVPRDLSAYRERYEALYEAYRVLPEKDVAKFGEDEKSVVRFLELGLESDENFHRHMLGVIAGASSAEKAAIALASYIKSPEGFALLNKSDISRLSAEEEASLTRIFGGVLGIKLSSDFVKSLRAEQMGSVLAYALSGLSEQDLREFHGNPLYKRQGTTVEKYLLEKMALCIMWLENDGGAQVPSAKSLIEGVSCS